MIPWTQEPQRGTAVARPKTGETPGRHIRIGNELWSQIGEIAREQDRTTTAVVIDALKRYVTWHKRQQKNAERQEGTEDQAR